ncbi:SH3 domain-containing protein [Streptomyces sp. NPDC127190]|uniref:SH3 domain-containing protein n=1 Tax=unclassified Streptomyces TaxID=2593676 RepID=UPI0036259767
MSLRSVLSRGLAIVTAAGTLACTVAAVPALADEDDGGGRDPRFSQGVVTAEEGMWLRDRPDRGSRRVRFVDEGERVSVFCETRGRPVHGNPVWYLLTDGTWAWGTARYIDIIGPLPRRC